MPSTTFSRPIFDAALISETHLEREKLVTAAKEARKFSWAGTGSAAISTTNNSKKVREYSHWCAHVGFLSPCLYVLMKLDFSAPIHDWQGGSYVSWVGKMLLFTAYCEHSVGFRSDINANLRQDVCFLSRDGKLPFILGADFNVPPSLWQDVSMHGGSQPLDTKVGQRISGPSRGNPHASCKQRVKNLTSSIVSWCQHTLDL